MQKYGGDFCIWRSGLNNAELDTVDGLHSVMRYPLERACSQNGPIGDPPRPIKLTARETPAHDD